MNGLTEQEKIDFFENIKNGLELTFRYKKKYYFLEGDKCLSLGLLAGDETSSVKTWFMFDKKDRKGNYQDFLDAKIFDGKTINEILNDIEWVCRT